MPPLYRLDWVILRCFRVTKFCGVDYLAKDSRASVVGEVRRSGLAGQLSPRCPGHCSSGDRWTPRRPREEMRKAPEWTDTDKGPRRWKQQLACIGPIEPHYIRSDSRRISYPSAFDGSLSDSRRPLTQCSVLPEKELLWLAPGWFD